jgi:hypothetical protein
MQGRLISRIGRVQRVDALSRLAALDISRWFGHEPRIVRPDVSQIQDQDVVLFKSFMGDLKVEPISVLSSALQQPTSSQTGAHAADKIAATLLHLRDVRGL